MVGDLARNGVRSSVVERGTANPKATGSIPVVHPSVLLVRERPLNMGWVESRVNLFLCLTVKHKVHK